MRVITILVLSIFLFGASHNGFSNIDSLKRSFHGMENGQERLATAYLIAKKTLFKDPDTTLKYLSIVLKDSATYEASDAMANCLNALSVYYFNKSQFDSTIFYANKAYGLYAVTGNKTKLMAPLKNEALARRHQGEFESALLVFFEILEFYKKENKTNKIASTLNDIGNTYTYLKDNKQALKYQSEALNYLKDAPNPRLEGNVLNSIGYTYDQMGHEDSAIAYYERSLVFKKQSGNIYGLTITLNNICTKIDYHKEAEKCESCYRELLAEQRKIHDSKGIARTFLNLSVLFSAHAKCELALLNLDSARYYLAFSDDLFLKQKYFKLYAKTLNTCDQGLLAYQYMDSLVKLNDSIYASEKRKELLELDTKYQTLQKTESINRLQIENANSQLEVQKQRWQISFLMIFLISLAGGAVFLILYIRQRQQKLKEVALVKMREAERIRIARDMHDEIGSGLTRISLISEQLRMSDDPQRTLEGPVTKIISQSRNLSKSLKEILWAIDPSNDTLSELVFYLRDYVYDFSDATQNECTLDLPDDDLDQEVSVEIRRNLFLVSKEILNNVAKHAQASQVEFILQHKENIVSLQITDNGCGFDLEQYKAGIGLESIRIRSEKIGAQCEIQSETGKGTTVLIHGIQLNTTNG